jgi:hypothetical protein
VPANARELNSYFNILSSSIKAIQSRLRLLAIDPASRMSVSEFLVRQKKALVRGWQQPGHALSKGGSHLSVE